MGCAHSHSEFFGNLNHGLYFVIPFANGTVTVYRSLASIMRSISVFVGFSISSNHAVLILYFGSQLLFKRKKLAATQTICMTECLVHVTISFLVVFHFYEWNSDFAMCFLNVNNDKKCFLSFGYRFFSPFNSKFIIRAKCSTESNEIICNKSAVKHAYLLAAIFF